MKRHALFVGVDQYADGHIPNLACAVSDATDLHGFFKYGAGYDRVELLPNPAGKKEVLGMVRELTADLGSGDFFLFFFAGHGFRVGENHVLVCAKDLYDDVKYEDDGLPLGQLKRRLSGAFDSALLLDACQSDILATRGGEGIAERDLSLIHEAPADRSGGALTIGTSCDAGQTAAELSERRHGLFTVAMLDLLKEAQKAHTRLDLSDTFRKSLGRRMAEIAARFGLPTEQRPRFSCTGNSCFVLVDGDSPEGQGPQEGEHSRKYPQGEHSRNYPQEGEDSKGGVNYAIVHGYEQFFLVDLKVKVFRDGEHVGDVQPYGILKIPIKEDCELSFKCLWRRAKAHIRMGVETNVYLSFNRFTGRLNASLATSGDRNV